MRAASVAMYNGEQLGPAASSAAAAKGSKTSPGTPFTPDTALTLHYCNFTTSLLMLKLKRWEELTGRASVQADTCSLLCCDLF